MAPRALLLASLLSAVAAAQFITPFEDVAEGSELEISWEKVSAETLPLYISGRVFNTTEEGVTSFQANISSNLTTPSFTWSNIPYPLPYIPTAHYELELLPLLASNQSTSTNVAKSPLFSIAPSSDSPPKDKRPPGPTAPEQEEPSSKPGGTNTNAIIVAVCVSLGIPVIIATVVCVWWTRRHRRRAKYEENRRMRYQTIID